MVKSLVSGVRICSKKWLSLSQFLVGVKSSYEFSMPSVNMKSEHNFRTAFWCIREDSWYLLAQADPLVSRVLREEFICVSLGALLKVELWTCSFSQRQIHLRQRKFRQHNYTAIYARVIPECVIRHPVSGLDDSASVVITFQSSHYDEILWSVANTEWQLSSRMRLSVISTKTAMSLKWPRHELLTGIQFSASSSVIQQQKLTQAKPRRMFRVE